VLPASRAGGGRGGPAHPAGRRFTYGRVWASLPLPVIMQQHKRTRSFQDLAAGRVSGPEPRYSVTGNTTPQDVEYSEEQARRNSLLASLMSQYLARGTLAIA